jgi:hypothetical protein
MSSFDPETHQQINAGLRQSLADCMPDASGGFVGVWDLPDRHEVTPMSDLAVPFFEHRMAGLDIPPAIECLVAEVGADTRRGPEPDLIGIGLIGHANMGLNGKVASVLAAVDGVSRQILWPHEQAQPTWEVKSASEVNDEDCTAIVGALANLLTALRGASGRDGGER